MATLEDAVAMAAIDRALTVYERLRDRDQAKLVQARKVVIEKAYAMVSAGESDVERIAVKLLTTLKEHERAR